MSALQEATRLLGGRWRAVAAPTQLQMAVARLSSERSLLATAPEDTAALQKRLAARFNSDGIVGFSFKEFRDLPSGFWLAPQPLDMHAELFAHFLIRLKATRSKNVMRRFVHAFLDRYPDKSKTFAKAREFIGAELPFFATKFVELEREWQTFSESGGVKRLADAVLKDGAQVLERAGLPDHLWTFRFVEEVFRQACRALKPTDVDQVARLSHFAIRPGVKRLDALRFPGSKVELVEGLLGKWRRKPPPPDSREGESVQRRQPPRAGEPTADVSLPD